MFNSLGTLHKTKADFSHDILEFRLLYPYPSSFPVLSFFMSLVETAKRANIPSNDYIEYVLTFAPYGSEDDSEWEKMLPWNIDLNRLNDHRAMIARAKVDENRKDPYILCGNSR